MELSLRTLVGVVLLLGGGFAILLSTSVLTFFQVISLTSTVDCALIAVFLMLAGVALAFWLSFQKRQHPTIQSRRNAL
ncbi:hypothetical protein [Bryobacter aggregatus]|uniref:hypothetical protein n=1 Tax=Bryobacter aggregatus TaxID=360054 RepID=UPI0012BAFB59|nr:hypothetical protein [Bryobacter aggregatus]